MTAVIVLGAATLYIMAQQARVTQVVDQVVKLSEYEDAPIEGKLSASVIRSAKKVDDSIKYGDMNERLPKKEREWLYEQEVRVQQEAASWDAQASSSPIQGVVLEYGFSS
jgi:hypothetical protein